MKNCETGCLNQYSEMFKKAEEDFDYYSLKEDIGKCMKKCDELYKNVIEHQGKGAEISYV
jgi:hypothetical protein